MMTSPPSVTMTSCWGWARARQLDYSRIIIPTLMTKVSTAIDRILIQKLLPRIWIGSNIGRNRGLTFFARTKDNKKIVTLGTFNLVWGQDITLTVAKIVFLFQTATGSRMAHVAKFWVNCCHSCRRSSTVNCVVL